MPNLVPCPTCNMTRTVTYEDRHAETRQDVCPECAPYEDTHPGMVPARTGETRESSADPATGRCPGEGSTHPLSPRIGPDRLPVCGTGRAGQ